MAPFLAAPCAANLQQNQGPAEVAQSVEQWSEESRGPRFAKSLGNWRLIPIFSPKAPWLLGEPYTRQLRGKLRELRFYLGRERQHVTYYIARGRRIILLTVFDKTKQQESSEIDRAERAMERCIRDGHDAEEIDR